MGEIVTRRKFLSWLAPLAVLPVVGPHALLSERPRIYALGEPHEAIWAVGWDRGHSEHTTVATWGRSRAKHCVGAYEHYFITSDVRDYREVFDREVRPYLTA